MATASVAGKTGRVVIGTTVAEVVDWEITRSVAALDATSMSSGGNVERIEGLADATGTMNTLQFINKIGVQAAATFGAGASAASNAPDIAGKIIITTEGVAVPMDEKVTYAYEFEFASTATVSVA